MRDLASAVAEDFVWFARPSAGREAVTECGVAVTRLRPGGFVAVWRIHGLPVRSFDTLPGRVTHVSGRLAKLSIERPGTCRSVGADVTVDAVVKPAGPGTWYEFRAGVRGPHTRSLVSQTPGHPSRHHAARVTKDVPSRVRLGTPCATPVWKGGTNPGRLTVH